MPRGYERMRDRFIREGMSPTAAKRKAARIWNAQHPDDPVHPGRERGGGGARRGRTRKK